MELTEHGDLVAQQRREVVLVGFRVFGGLDYCAMHSANYDLTPNGERGSATCWDLEILPSPLDRLRENGQAPIFRTLPVDQHFPRPIVFLFRWSPQIQLTYATRIMVGFECLQLEHWSSPLQAPERSYSWTIEQQLLDLQGRLVQAFRRAAVVAVDEYEAKATLANMTRGWDCEERVRHFLSPSEEAQLLARFQSCRDLFPRTVKLLNQAYDQKSPEPLLAEAVDVLKAESLIYSALPSEIADLSGDRRRQFRRAQRELLKRTDDLDRRLSDPWDYLGGLSKEELGEFLRSRGWSGELQLKSLRRRHERLGLFSKLRSGPAALGTSPSDKTQLSSAIGFHLVSFPERYVARC
jgi:hypothetical protein